MKTKDPKEIELVYAQLYPQLQLPKLPVSSTPSCNDDRIVSCPYLLAMS